MRADNPISKVEERLAMLETKFDDLKSEVQNAKDMIRDEFSMVRDTLIAQIIEIRSDLNAFKATLPCINHAQQIGRLQGITAIVSAIVAGTVSFFYSFFTKK